jgi:hypothetical protein
MICCVITHETSITVVVIYLLYLVGGNDNCGNLG